MIELLNQPVVRLLASDSTKFEGEAIRQLQQTARLDGMEITVGMPDLHPGKGHPVGLACLSKKGFYPHLIGNDVGCGMGLYRTSAKVAKIKRDKWVKKLGDMENPWDGEIAEWLSDHNLESTDYDAAMGTIGGGNHFAELQSMEELFFHPALEQIGLDKNYLVLLVHSGSRGIGEALLRKHAAVHGAGSLMENSVEAQEYLARHNFALKWARSNRDLIAQRFCSQIGEKCEPVLDCFHNFLTPVDLENSRFWLHHKGAVPSNQGPVIVAGTRGSLSYIIEPLGEQNANLWSLAHGAGRKWNRSSCKERLRSKCTAKSLTHTSLGSRVICENRELLYEEAPQAYKNVDVVVAEMEKAGFIRKIASLRPLITYKTREST